MPPVLTRSSSNALHLASRQAACKDYACERTVVVLWSLNNDDVVHDIRLNIFSGRVITRALDLLRNIQTLYNTPK